MIWSYQIRRDSRHISRIERIEMRPDAQFVLTACEDW